MNETEKLIKRLNEIFDGCYSKELSVCPKHTLFRRQKALNEILPMLKEAGLKFVRTIIDDATKYNTPEEASRMEITDIELKE